MEESIFKAYENAVKAIWSSGLSKTLAIRLSENPNPGVISVEKLRHLFNALSSEGWKRNHGSNWLWRATVPVYVTDSREVEIEREIAKLDPSTWTCQMSTSSGVQPNGLNRRRAIDLVRDNGNGRFAFVELKVNSNNPLYAAFEILGYALAYLQARSAGWQASAGMEGRNVLKAKEIELTVLGPEEWYGFKKRSGERGTFNFEWLAADIANSLNGLSQGAPFFTMSFRKYANGGVPPAKVAANICELATSKWWQGGGKSK